MKRRTFIAGGLGALALLAGGMFFAKGAWYRKAANSVRNLTGDLDAQFLRQIITQDAAHSRTLMWQAEAVLNSPAVEYRVRGQEDVQRVIAQEDFFTDDGVKNNQYVAKLQDLQAATEYEYRVVTETAASDWHALHTAKKGGFECLIFPDSQSSDYSDW
ncbi:fibronectin type III domain-containing protein [Selenomonas sp.]|uniref:fibronectin type III domain-containing protein n=1 Tax=Selenomonas sp. TaxID=2053611 RepID=UPI003455BDB7